MSIRSILLLPGLDATGIMFGPLARALSGRLEAKTFSYPQRKECGYDELVGLVLDSLPEGDFLLLGESYSGPIALRIAARAPRGLKGVVLCATFIRNPSRLVPSFLRFLAVPPLFFVWPVSVKVRALTGMRSDPEIKRLLGETRRRTNSSALAARTREVLGVDVVEEFRRCPCPLLYLGGRRDIVVGGHNLASMLRIRPDMEAAMLDTSHLVLQEAPAEAADRILEFARRVEAA